MARGLAMAVLAVALMIAGQASGQSWQAVSTDQNKNQFDLDMESITANGAYTRSFVRQTLARPARDAASGKRYVTVVMQRMDDCRGRTFALVTFAYADDKGQVVSSSTVPQRDWQFVGPPPGSIAAGLQAKICGIVAQRASLKPSLDTGPATKANWLPTAYDPQTQTRYFVRQDAVIALDGGMVGVILRAENGRPITLQDGTAISTGYIAEAFDCQGRKVATFSVDSYDSAGNLVAVYSPPAEKVETLAFTPGSSSELIAKYVCDEKHIVSTEDEAGATYVGTGWLGPKGYIITANHVIEGATQLELAYGGKVIGTAELVVADPANDIAILKPILPPGIHVAIPFAAAPARMGERVFTLGYPAPDVLGMALKMTSGEVSAMSGGDVATGRMDDARFMQVSIPIHSGNSGGPVIDDQGRAVGIVISKMNKTGADEVAQNVNYALKIGYVRNLLAELPAVGAPPAATPRPSITGLVEELQGSVFLVVATHEAEK